MIELFEQNYKEFTRHSSKGNQLKWENNGIWYKADFTGYEGLAEFVVSELLKFSTLDDKEFVTYDIEEIKYKRKIYLGARSKNFLDSDYQIITIERLFKNRYKKSLSDSLWNIDSPEARLKFICHQVINMTGLQEFGEYMSKLLTIDALFKNEDRHLHNVAVLMNSNEEFKLCPIFDNGASLLSDITTDYPLGENIYVLLDEAKSKTISFNFDEEIEAAEKLYGNNIKFYFTHRDVEDILNRVNQYDEDIKNRVKDIIFYQMLKYQYLFDRH